MALLIHLEDPRFTDELCSYFERSGFEAHARGPGVAQVAMPEVSDAAQSRREIELHLRVWQAIRPMAHAFLTGAPGRAN